MTVVVVVVEWLIIVQEYLLLEGLTFAQKCPVNFLV